MNKQEKQAITLMRENGYSYADIATHLHINENSVKSYGRRHQLTVQRTIELPFCKQCNFPFQQNPKTKRRLFCCNKCKQKWWNAQR